MRSKHSNPLKKTPLVTVVMPAYNAGRFIREAIESVLNQNFERFELIVMDDDSRDETYRIAKQYEQDVRVRVYRNPKRLGPSRTRNRILALARGKYIAPHDADDIMLQGRLGMQCDFLEKHPDVGVVFGKAIAVNEKMKAIISDSGALKKDKTPAGKAGVAKNLPAGFNHGTAMIRKKYILKAGKYEDSLPLGGDGRLMRKIFRLTPFYFLNRFCFVYRMNSLGICRSRLRECKNRMARIFYSKKNKEPSTWLFDINNYRVRIRSKISRFAKAALWRLNFYLRHEQRDDECKKEHLIDFEPSGKKEHRESDADSYQRYFLRPLAAAFLKSNKIILEEAGLVACQKNGFLVFAEEDVRAEALLAFLARDFYYYSSNNPILHGKNGRVFGEALVDPLMLLKPIMKADSHCELWGQFWNPIRQKYFLNVFFYRPYLIGSECEISKVLFFQRDNSAHNIKIEKVSFGKALNHLKAIGRRQANEQLLSKSDRLLVKAIRQSACFLIRAPHDKLRSAVFDFVNRFCLSG